MPEEVEYNEFGEVIEEVWESIRLSPFLDEMNVMPEKRNRISSETVMNYRRSKSKSKLTDFERCSLTGEAWVAPLNKKQRERLKNA